MMTENFTLLEEMITNLKSTVRFLAAQYVVIINVGLTQARPIMLILHNNRNRDASIMNMRLWLVVKDTV